MEQPFPLGNDTGGDNDSLEDWTLSSGGGGGGGGAMSQQRMMNHRPQQMHLFGSLPMRSNPIAIKRNPEDDKRYPDTSDDELDDSSTIDVEMDALKIASTTSRRPDVSSLPSHLLHAPRLQSLPSRDDSWINQRYPSMLPPAMNVADQPLAGTPSGVGFSLGRGDDRATSYGSLRESHNRGRFLDGPSSYRDKETGDIRRIQQRVRFRDTGPVASSLPSISIGERIMKSRQKKANSNGSNEAKEKEPTSSLAALLEASDKTDPEPQLPIVEPAKIKTPTFYDQDIESRLPQHMLSTSLTGLEVLQAGLRNGASGASSPPSSIASPAHFTLDAEELPRDANGHNALLSRSFSDPTPRHLSARPVVVPGVANPGLLLPPRNSSLENFQQLPPSLRPASVSPPTRTMMTASAAAAGAPPVIDYHLEVHNRMAPQENTMTPRSDHNPDTDCGFEFEME